MQKSGVGEIVEVTVGIENGVFVDMIVDVEETVWVNSGEEVVIGFVCPLQEDIRSMK